MRTAEQAQRKGDLKKTKEINSHSKTAKTNKLLH